MGAEGLGGSSGGKSPDGWQQECSQNLRKKVRERPRKAKVLYE